MKNLNVLINSRQVQDEHYSRPKTMTALEEFDHKAANDLPAAKSLHENANHSSSIYSHLPATNMVLKKNQQNFVNCRLIVLQHIKSDTEAFLHGAVDAGADIFKVIGKPNSVDHQAAKRIGTNFPLLIQEYSTLESSGILDEILDAAIDKCKMDGRFLTILDVGGYFAAPVARLKAKNSWPLAGVVEVTTFGHNRYAKLLSELEFPVFSVARSAIKELEARFVGAAAANSVEKIARDIGIALPGRSALVNGFGMIGRNVASALRAKGMNVSVYDTRAFPIVDAATLGYHVGEKKALLENSEFLFSATAAINAINETDFSWLRNGAFLASVGSRTNEFDMTKLDHCLHTPSRSEHVEKVIFKEKSFNLLNGGKSVNFLVGSCQDEIIDLLFAEIATCLAQLLSSPPKYLRRLHTSTAAAVDEISKDWLSSRYMKVF